jgi:hypothetical protein
VGVAGSNPATPTIRFTKQFNRLVNFLNFRKNMKKALLCHSEIDLWRHCGYKTLRGITVGEASVHQGPLADMTWPAKEPKGKTYRQPGAHLVDLCAICDGVTEADVKREVVPHLPYRAN